MLSCATCGCWEVSSSSYHMSTTVIIMPCHEPEDPGPRKPCTKASEDVSWNVLSQMFGTVMKNVAHALSVLIILFQREKILGLLGVKRKFFFLFFF